MLTPLIAAALRSHTLKLVDQGRPMVEIDIRYGDSAAARAASILQSSVQKMSGAVLPIVQRDEPAKLNFVAIGYDPSFSLSEPLKRDGFALHCDSHGLYVCSGGNKGSVYGVVQLLEQYFGCRCYSPSVYAFPKRQTLDLANVDIVDNPAMEFRVVNGEFEGDEDWLDWQRLDRVGEMFGAGYYVHTFAKLVPPGIYFGKHPEYFALIDGKRSPNQLCPSCPENVDIAVQKLKEEMALQPDKLVWSVSQNANPYYCHCPECEQVNKEEGSPSGALLRFVNEVAAHFPNKIIATLAYEFSRPAPRITKPAPNVLIMLCTIELNRSKPIADDPTGRDFVKDIEDWSKIAPRLYIWDYTVDFAHQVCPFPNLPVLQPNIKLFVGSGVRQVFEQTNTANGHEFSELKSYLLSRLMWDPNADVPAIEKDFLDGYYGAAGPFIGQYIARAEEELRRSETRLDIFGRPTDHKEGFLSEANLRAYNALFDKAEYAVRREGTLLQRVKVARLPLEYATLEIGWADAFGPRGFFTRDGNDVEAKPAMRSTLEDFYSTCARNDVRTLNESGLTPKEYCDAATKMLDLQVKGNFAFGKKVSASPAPSSKYGGGDPSLLTNGIRGGSDFGIQWLGWEGTDFDLTVDLGKVTNASEAFLDTLSNQRSWILHPISVTCAVSADGTDFRLVGSELTHDDQEHEPIIHTYSFRWKGGVRYVRFHVEGTKTLPAWHASPGGKSWVFVDETVVK